MNAIRHNLIQTIANTHAADRNALVELLRGDVTAATELYQTADRSRAEHVGDEIHLRALIEFSNSCARNCRYCGLRREHDGLTRYRMPPADIIETAQVAIGLGYRTIVLQSGEDSWYTAELLTGIVRGIKASGEVVITLSVGERSEAEYRALREAGADRYLLRIETSSPILYASLHPEGSWQERFDGLQALRRTGFQVGSGVMIGLPGQTLTMLADDLLFLQALDLDMIGVGPFIAHPATPLADESGGTLELALRFIACLRLLCPEAHLPATTALGALDPTGCQQALQAGANILMPNCTPVEYRAQYQLYPGKICMGASVVECRGCVERMVAGLGRTVGQGLGHSLRSQRVPTGGRSANG